VSRGTERF